jgi:hypothetical protein
VGSTVSTGIPVEVSIDVEDGSTGETSVGSTDGRLSGSLSRSRTSGGSSVGVGAGSTERRLSRF